VEEARPAWKRILLSIVLTFGLIILLMLAAGLMLIGSEIVQQVAAPLGLTPVVITLWLWLRWPLAILLLMLAVSTAYAIFPATKQRFQLLSPGAVFAVIIWVVASYAFSFYVQHIGNYSATYGSLGAVVMLIFYFYLSAAVLLFGAEINAARRAPAAPVEREQREPIVSVAPLRERAIGQDGDGSQSR
ncbi:MAG TPA: YihY/virulence factor BrkB family protein, partial [Roseiflexaceae bacterium]|nr:YihY/virulence factor BrkB family protein [Roseiflexaceae bacterium]